MEADRKAPKKQRHTATRIFHRLRDEHGYPGGYTSVRTAVREWKRSTQEVFLPLSHPPGQAQVDFGYAYIDLAGACEQVAFLVVSFIEILVNSMAMNVHQAGGQQGSHCINSNYGAVNLIRFRINGLDDAILYQDATCTAPVTWAY
ncbi:hypothetical protein [Adhaeretor mobilis]|uniref:hypothetical protein n=1 Tax=Adhaeretor mobilis TaxID=1930276 RepID=UPI0011A5F815|nr:hypothetical protein [Adhaeretor mobilis]